MKTKYYGQVHAGETDDEEVHGGCEEVPQVTQGQGPQERGASYHHGQQGDKGVWKLSGNTFVLNSKIW